MFHICYYYLFKKFLVSDWLTANCEIVISTQWLTKYGFFTGFFQIRIFHNMKNYQALSLPFNINLSLRLITENVGLDNSSYRAQPHSIIVNYKTYRYNTSCKFCSFNLTNSSGSPTADALALSWFSCNSRCCRNF